MATSNPAAKLEVYIPLLIFTDNRSKFLYSFEIIRNTLVFLPFVNYSPGKILCSCCLLASWEWMSFFLEQYAHNSRLLWLFVPCESKTFFFFNYIMKISYKILLLIVFDLCCFTTPYRDIIHRESLPWHIRYLPLEHLLFLLTKRQKSIPDSVICLDIVFFSLVVSLF